MLISFSPIRSDESLSLNRDGDSLIINGDTLDFSDLSPGETRDRAEWSFPWIVADPCRGQDGRLRITVRLPHKVAASPKSLYPNTVRMDRDGPVPLPGV